MRRKPLPLVLLCLLAAAVAAAPAGAIAGATDRVPAPSLLVPYFETGINSTTHPHDTLLVVTNVLDAGQTIHYQFWDIDGNATGLQGNVVLAARDTWSVALRDLITPASAPIKTQLTDGEFYRGFLTIDLVTAPTALHPAPGRLPLRHHRRARRVHLLHAAVAGLGQRAGDGTARVRPRLGRLPAARLLRRRRLAGGDRRRRAALRPAAHHRRRLHRRRQRRPRAHPPAPLRLGAAQRPQQAGDLHLEHLLDRRRPVGPVRGVARALRRHLPVQALRRGREPARRFGHPPRPRGQRDRGRRAPSRAGSRSRTCRTSTTTCRSMPSPSTRRTPRATPT